MKRETTSTKATAAVATSAAAISAGATSARSNRAGAYGTRRAPWQAGALLGVGLGGLFDGIVLHQILQWHHLLTAVDRFTADSVGNLEDNTLADGLFHGFAWIAIVVGLWLLWTSGPESGRGAGSGRALLGWLAVGWGAFNLVEGVVDHHLLGLHHVRDDIADPLAWDLAFLAFGALLIILGATLVRSGRREQSKAEAPA